MHYLSRFIWDAIQKHKTNLPTDLFAKRHLSLLVIKPLVNRGWGNIDAASYYERLYF